MDIYKYKLISIDVSTPGTRDAEGWSKLVGHAVSDDPIRMYYDEETETIFERAIPKSTWSTIGWKIEKMYKEDQNANKDDKE